MTAVHPSAVSWWARVASSSATGGPGGSSGVTAYVASVSVGPVGDVLAYDDRRGVGRDLDPRPALVAGIVLGQDELVRAVVAHEQVAYRRGRWPGDEG